METNIVDVQRKKYHTISARPIPALQTFWFLHEITLHEIQVSETAPMTQTMQKKHLCPKLCKWKLCNVGTRCTLQIFCSKMNKRVGWKF